MGFDTKKHDIARANRREIASDGGPASAWLRRGKLDLEIAFFGADDAKAALLHGFEVRTAREEDDVGAGLREPRADVAADRAGAGDDNPHEAFGANACATTRRWILPVAVRGIASVM